jgi:hypothetical protein
MTLAIRQMLAVCVVLAFAACGSGSPGSTGTRPPVAGTAPDADTPADPHKPESMMHVSGTVRSQTGVRSVSSTLYLADVRATIDRNHDGSISADETWTTVSDGDGAYALDVPVDPGDTLVVRFSDVNGAAVLRTVKAAPRGSMILNATLGTLEEPECVGIVCAWTHADLTLVELPPGARVRARVFNPITESYALPDHMQDPAGNLLVPAVFAAFEVDDDRSLRLGKLADFVEMRLRIPRDTWDVVRDVDSGNDRIDVPLYWFDEVKGAWVRDPVPAHLEDGERNVIAPSLLPGIRDGSFAGVIHAVANVNHLSTWSVGWPIGGSAYVSGRVLDGAGKPAEGAAVTLDGVSYTGTSTAVIIGPDGRFCLEARRSEPPGEDLDGNGRMGEKATVSIAAVAGGKFYDLGEFATPIAGGSCGSASLDFGDLRLTAGTQRNADWCTIKGTVKYPDGTAAGDEINLWDDGVRPDVLNSMCSSGLDWICKTAHVDPETGAFSVTAPVLRDLKLESGAARAIEPGATEISVAVRNFTSCPKEPVALTLAPRSIFVHFAVATAGNAISWTPSRYGISVVTVWSASGMKWQSYAWNGTVMRAPVTYGESRGGAVQSYPPHGAPAPLAPGDWVSIETLGTNIGVDGVPYSGSGSTTVR